MAGMNTNDGGEGRQERRRWRVRNALGLLSWPNRIVSSGDVRSGSAPGGGTLAAWRMRRGALIPGILVLAMMAALLASVIIVPLGFEWATGSRSAGHGMRTGYTHIEPSRRGIFGHVQIRFERRNHGSTPRDTAFGTLSVEGTIGATGMTSQSPREYLYLTRRVSGLRPRQSTNSSRSPRTRWRLRRGAARLRPAAPRR